MLTQTLAIARNAYVESVRQPVLFLLVLLSGLLQVFNTFNSGFSMGQEESGQVSGDTKLLFDVGLGTIFVIGTLLAGFVATAVMSREIENKTVLTVISKPIGRPVVVLGKFLGVAGAISGGVIVMLIFLLFAIRHGVMSTASDELDGPVLLFALGGVGLTLLVAGWCNFFYGWNFPQAVLTLLVPTMVVAYVMTLLLSPHWKWQPIGKDFKDQVMVACAALGLAILVLTSVATCASTRLGQVMTILVCLGVFVSALLSNYVLGRRVFRNDTLGVIATAQPDDVTRTGFNTPGETWTIRLEQVPRQGYRQGESFYYGPSPSGFPLVSRGVYPGFAGDLTELSTQIGPGVPSALVVLESSGQRFKVRNIGETPLPVSRPPERGDYVFATPTSINPVALAAWGAVPNLQFFWLLDAVSQNRSVPPRYLGLVSLYALCQIGVFLSLGVVLFQRRDVG